MDPISVSLIEGSSLGSGLSAEPTLQRLERPGHSDLQHPACLARTRRVHMHTRHAHDSLTTHTRV
jgi:hypothetical protein